VDPPTIQAVPSNHPALRFSGVALRFDGGPPVLRDIDWEVGTRERWVILGPNGSGKTSVVRLAAGWVHPSAGVVEILGHRLGRVDVRALRERIGFASGALAARLRPTVTAVDAVVSAKHGALEAWWHHYEEADFDRARGLLERMGCAHLVDRPVATASDGERQRIQLARTLMVDPELLLLDEPTAGLDLGGREALLERLAGIATDPAAPPTVLVTHHVEEIPPGFTHLLLLAPGGRALAAGPLEETLTAGALGAAFGVAVGLERRAGRWMAVPPET
jgi:iron complex transport system ATP-binding protein